MRGFPLRCYDEKLRQIPRYASPVWTISGLKEKLLPYRDYIEARRTWPKSRKEFIEECGRLPRKALSQLTFEDIAKIYWSRSVRMHDSMVKLFESHASYELVRKLQNSMFHWGFGKDTDSWNTMVSAYHAIRRFDFGLPGFSARLDYSTYGNFRGFAKCSRVFLDGTFGFLIYRGNMHVMTIGFSVSSHNRLLVTQIQLAHAKGNRFLYQLPLPYVDHALCCIEKAFQGFSIFLVDGASLNKNVLEQYREGIREVSRWLKEDRLGAPELVKQRTERHIVEYRELKKRAIKCTEALPRMVCIYGNLYAHRRILERPEMHRKLLFHPVIPLAK